MAKARKVDHDEVLRLYKDGFRPSEIAERMRLTPTGVYYIIQKNVWQPRSTTKLGTKIQFRLPPDLRERAETYVNREELTMTELMRIALREFLDNHQPKKKERRKWRD